MNEKNFLERLRARARHELSETEQAALERELAAEPALRGLAEDFELVHALTKETRPQPISRTRLEDLEKALPRPAFSRRVAAAAALVLVSAGAFLAGRLSVAKEESPLYLSSIELDRPSPSAPVSPDVPVQWASFDPRGDEGVRFLSNLAEAEQLARAVRRPLLVYGSYPDCPMCVALDVQVFSGPRGDRPRRTHRTRAGQPGGSQSSRATLLYGSRLSVPRGVARGRATGPLLGTQPGSDSLPGKPARRARDQRRGRRTAPLAGPSGLGGSLRPARGPPSSRDVYSRPSRASVYSPMERAHPNRSPYARRPGWHACPKRRASSCWKHGPRRAATSRPPAASSNMRGIASKGRASGATSRRP